MTARALRAGQHAGGAAGGGVPEEATEAMERVMGGYTPGAKQEAEPGTDRRGVARAPPQPGAPAAAAVLEPGWGRAVDRRTGRTYYYNRKLGLTQWELPGGEKAAQSLRMSPAARADSGADAQGDGVQGQAAATSQHGRATETARPGGGGGRVGRTRDSTPSGVGQEHRRRSAVGGGGEKAPAPDMRPVYSAHWIRGQHATAAHTGVSGVPSTHAAQASTASTLQTGARAHVNMMQATSQKLSLSQMPSSPAAAAFSHGAATTAAAAAAAAPPRQRTLSRATHGMGGGEGVAGRAGGAVSNLRDLFGGAHTRLHALNSVAQQLAHVRAPAFRGLAASAGAGGSGNKTAEEIAAEEDAARKKAAEVDAEKVACVCVCERERGVCVRERECVCVCVCVCV